MAEYIDIDAPVVVTDTRGRERETTVRHILKMNKGVYTAADVRPVVRGKWISNDDGETIIKLKYGEPQGSCFCSVCHEWLVASDEYDVKGNFCPNCGADMRGTNDEKA